MRQFSRCFAQLHSILGCFIWLSTAIAGSYNGTSDDLKASDHSIIPSAECSQYESNKRSAGICKSFDSAHTRTVDDLPEEADENTLYIINKQTVTIKSLPYIIPKGSAIIPSPTLPKMHVRIQVKDITDSKHMIILKEGAKVNGIMIQAPYKEVDDQKSSVIYGETRDSEVSDSYIVGSPGNISLISQKFINDGDPRTNQRYIGNTMLLRGSKNALLVEGAAEITDMEDYNNRPGHADVFVSFTNIELSSSVPSSPHTPRGLFFVNINPEVRDSSFYFSDLQRQYEPSTVDHQSAPPEEAFQGIFLQDTPRVQITNLNFSSQLEEKGIVRVVVEKQYRKPPRIYADKESYSWLAETLKQEVSDHTVSLVNIDDKSSTMERAKNNSTKLNNISRYTDMVGEALADKTQFATLVHNITSINSTNPTAFQNNGHSNLVVWATIGVIGAVLVTGAFLAAFSGWKWGTREPPAMAISPINTRYGKWMSVSDREL